MKVSLNWTKQCSSVDLQKISIDKLLEKIGTQIGAIEEIEEWGSKFDGLVVVKVVSCISHPNADKLSICTVDDDHAVKGVKRDSMGNVQVVCGAPNVHAGMLAVWIPPGSVVPASIDKEVFRLESREIRGQVSNGMLASASELGIGSDHSGILEVEASKSNSTLAKPGVPFKKLYSMDDTVIDIENKMFTHRPDCFGVLGVAREIAGIQGIRFKSPAWYLDLGKQSYASTKLKLKVKNQVPKLVPRFMAQVVVDIQVGPSPVWMQAALTRVGIKSINNIVDLSNFYMHLTAQPTHAFDYDKLKALSGAVPTLQPRMAKKGEKLKLLGEKTITLSEDDIVIATDKHPVALAGIMGGSETEVDANTKTIVIEAATFDMYAVRRSSMRHGLFTDAVTRFSKGQSPLQNDRVLAEMVSKLRDRGAKPTSLRFDLKTSAVVIPDSVMVTTAFINERLGLKLNTSQIIGILENVEFSVKSYGKKLAVKPPFWRTDIEIPEDVVEEVGRLHGYDKLSVSLPSRTIETPYKNHLFDFKNKLRSVLADLGASEVLSYSFIHGDLLTRAGQSPAKAFKLSNALSPYLQYYRLSITPSLLEKIRLNIKAGYEQFAIFEIGKTHQVDEMEDDLPLEKEMLAFSLAAHDRIAEQFGGAPYYIARQAVEALLSKIGIEASFQPLSTTEKDQLYRPYAPKRSALVVDKQSEKVLGVVGEYKLSVSSDLKLPKINAGFELNVDELMSVASELSDYRPLSRYPKVQQDISLRVKSKLSFKELNDELHQALKKLKPINSTFTLSPIDIFQSGDDDSHKHISFRLVITSNERTLTAEEINNLLDEVALIAHDSLGAERL